MSKGIFITATGTDIGKTYVAALIVKKMREAGYCCGYYKAALSGAKTIGESDAGYVKRVSGISQRDDTLVSYVYHTAVSPHLAAKIEGNPMEPEEIRRGYRAVQKDCDYVTVEGSGGILCPLRWDEQQKILLKDVIRMLELSVLVVADAGLGTINATVLTVDYLKKYGIKIQGIILNRFADNEMERDNWHMIEELSQVPVVAAVREGGREIEIPAETLRSFYQ